MMPAYSLPSGHGDDNDLRGNTLQSSIFAPSLHSNQFFETKSMAGPAYLLQHDGSTSKA
jgi:hypothetical protein